jgi:acyl-coenzyme A thioesterase PaaI-like protein
MTIYVAGLLSVFLFLVTALVMYLLHHLIAAKDQQIANLKEAQGRLQNALDEIEAVKERSRQTGATMAAAEDAMAAIANVIVNRDIEQVRLNAALNYLQDLRKGPFAYNPEKTSGDREAYQ